MSEKFLNTDVLILCGGKGSRLQPLVSDRPKSMADVGGTPFLDILLDSLSAQGLGRFILCTGFMGDYIEEYYLNKKTDLKILFSHEKHPLGTGGAVKKAKKLIKSKNFLVLNGDSYCDMDYCNFIDFHLQKGALLTIAVSGKDDSKDYGAITFSDNKKLTGFCEKSAVHGRVYVNTGIYCMNSNLFSRMPDQEQLSLEHDLFPLLLNNQCFVYITKNEFFDIGTPERYNLIREKKL